MASAFHEHTPRIVFGTVVETMPFRPSAELHDGVDNMTALRAPLFDFSKLEEGLSRAGARDRGMVVEGK